MPTIKFEKVLRNSDANKARIADGSGGLIYDYDVIIDGERRAVFWRSLYSVGFDLHDTNLRLVHERYTSKHPITGMEREHTSAVTRISKGSFERKIEELLADNRIPTVAEAVMTKLQNAAEADNIAFDRHIDDVREAKERAAEQLYDALEEIARYGLAFLEFAFEKDVAAKVFDALQAATLTPNREDDNEA